MPDLKTDHYRRLENMYHAAPVNRIFEPSLVVSDGRAVITQKAEARFFHAAMALHGSVYFKALDDAAFFAVNSLVEEDFVVTVSFNVYLLKPVTGGMLRAEGTVTSVSKKLFVAEAVLSVEGSGQVARGSGTFMRSRMKLASVEAYR